MLNIRHVGIYVEDIEKMKKFYCSNFSFIEKNHEFEEGVYIDTILGLNQSKIELYKLVSPCGEMIELLKCHVDNSKRDYLCENVWDKGRSHIAITVDDVDKYYKLMHSQELVFVSEPCVSPNGYAKVCFLRDPEGNYIELVEELALNK